MTTASRLVVVGVGCIIVVRVLVVVCDVGIGSEVVLVGIFFCYMLFNII